MLAASGTLAVPAITVRVMPDVPAIAVPRLTHAPPLLESILADPYGFSTFGAGKPEGPSRKDIMSEARGARVARATASGT